MESEVYESLGSIPIGGNILSLDFISRSKASDANIDKKSRVVVMIRAIGIQSNVLIDCKFTSSFADNARCRNLMDVKFSKKVIQIGDGKLCWLWMTYTVQL